MPSPEKLAQIHALVRRIDRETYRSGDESYFIYDPSAKSFLNAPPLFWGASRMQYYHVTCSGTGSPDASGTLGPIGVQDPSDGTRVRVQVGYEAWILPENAADVVRAVAGDEPGQRLAHLVIEAVQRRASIGASSFFAELPTGAAGVARELEQQLLQQHGLSTALTLHLVTGELPSDLPLIELDVPVHLADHVAELSLTVRLVVSVRDQARAIDAMNRWPRLKETLRAACREFFVDIKLPRFRAELSGALQQELRGRLEQILVQWYLRLRTFSLSLSDKLPAPIPFVEVASECPIEIYKFPRPVRLRTRVQLELADETQYHRAGDPPLKEWVEEGARPILQQVLFKVRYSQLCIEMDKWEGEILIRLQEAAAAIGYKVKAQITTPEVPEREFLEPFRIILSERFATAVDIVQTGLELFLRLQLTNLQAVAKELDRGADLKKLFQDLVREETASYLHTLQPGFVFTRFSLPADHTGKPLPEDQAIQDERLPVENELQQRIGAALKNRYGLILHSFKASQGPSQIRGCYLALMKAASISFDVDVPLQGHGEPLPHRGTLQVLGVAEEGWSRFQSVLPTPNHVKQAVIDGVYDLLASHSGPLGATGLTEQRVRQIVMGGPQPERARTPLGADVPRQGDPRAPVTLAERMRTQLGLSIAVISWYRVARSGPERALSHAQEEAFGKLIEANARVLQAANHGQFDDWQAKRKQIAQLEAEERILRLQGKSREADDAQKRANELRGDIDAQVERSRDHARRLLLPMVAGEDGVENAESSVGDDHDIGPGGGGKDQAALPRAAPGEAAGDDTP